MQSAAAQAQDFKPVSRETLMNPDPADWLMWRRTHNSWGYSPLNQINTSNVGKLATPKAPAALPATSGDHPPEPTRSPQVSPCPVGTGTSICDLPKGA